MAPRSVLKHYQQPGKFQPTLPGIDFVPAKVRKHGLREAHTHPRVSEGRKPDGSMSIFRVQAVKAWRPRDPYLQIELNTPNSWPALLFDVDRKHAHEWTVDLAYDGLIPWLNWTVERLASTHVHAVLTLARPVLRGEVARENPQRVLARISEYLAQTIGADRGYRGVLTYNPMVRSRQYKTRWGRPQPYTLDELRTYIPKGWRMPAPEELITVVGRNNWLFQDGTRWRWRAENRHLDVLDYLVDQNEVLPERLSFVEVRGIAKSIDRYWERNGREHTREWRGKQRSRQCKQVEARHRETAPRDSEIMLLDSAGWSVREIAAHMKIPKSTVHDVLTRDGYMQLPLDMLDTVPPPPSRMKRQDRINRIGYLHQQGWSQRQIAAELDLPRRTVRRILLRLSEAN